MQSIKATCSSESASSKAATELRAAADPSPAPAQLADTGFNLATAPFQRTLPAELYPAQPSFPTILAPDGQPNFDESVALVRSLGSSDQLKQLLLASGGAVLLRGLSLDSADAFSQIAHAAGLGVVHEEVGRPPKRTLLAPAVNTANEGPPTAFIFTHNEYGWSSLHPDYVLFFALRPADERGETPINSGVELAALLEKRAPEFYEKLKTRRLTIQYRYGAEDNAGSNTGASAKTAYGCQILPTDSAEEARAKIEVEVRKHSNEFKWEEDGSLSVWHYPPVIKEHASGLPTFFSTLLSAYGRAKFHHALEPPFLGDDGGFHPLPLYGDGTTIDPADIEFADQIVNETRVLVPWQQGDMVILDNHAVQHARVPWKGERRILASLWDNAPAQEMK